MSVIELKNVTYFYNEGQPDEIKAINNLTVDFKEGEFVALVGHNGSGKSTLARLFNGLLLPQKGSVTVYGKQTTDKKSLFDIRASLGVVFQNPDNQMVATIIEDDVAFGPENLGLKPEEIRQRVDFALKSVDMSEHTSGTPFRLSGGQKQRIAIAGVLALKPKIMVLDEATSMLDPLSRGEVLKVISTLIKEQNLTVIMITHFMEEAALADRIVVLKDGSIIADGAPREIFSYHDKLEDAGLELPAPASLAHKLKEAGLDIRADILSIDELVEQLTARRAR